MVNKELANYIVPMSEQFPNHINVYKPDVSFFINRIKNNEPFSFIKLNHAFWELVIEVEKDLFKFEPYINDLFFIFIASYKLRYLTFCSILTTSSAFKTLPQDTTLPSTTSAGVVITP